MKSDRPIGLYFGKKPDVRAFNEEPLFPLSNKYVGIEIEAENIPYLLDDISQKLMYWDVTIDNSLRNYGAEFITKMLRGKDIILAFDELDNFLKTNSVSPSYTNRTSVHIHVDARYLLLSQLKSLILLYMVYEPLFFKYIGAERDKNNYCIPFFRNPQAISNLSSLFNPKLDSERALGETVRHVARYEAMNLKSLEKHGSIEFRHHYGTHDRNKLIPWIQALLLLAREAKYTTEADILAALDKDYPTLVSGVNNYLKVTDLAECERIAKTTVTSLLVYSTP
jgi:hypothetical protein